MLNTNSFTPSQSQAFISIYGSTLAEASSAGLFSRHTLNAGESHLMGFFIYISVVLYEQIGFCNEILLTFFVKVSWSILCRLHSPIASSTIWNHIFTYCLLTYLLTCLIQSFAIHTQQWYSEVSRGCLPQSTFRKLPMFLPPASSDCVVFFFPRLPLSFWGPQHWTTHIFILFCCQTQCCHRSVDQKEEPDLN